MPEAWKTRAGSSNIRIQPSHSEELRPSTVLDRFDGSNAVVEFLDVLAIAKAESEEEEEEEPTLRGGGLR